MSKRFIIVLVAITAGLIGIFWLTKDPAPTTSSKNIQPTNHVTGKGIKNVTLVEYGDYQCPVCAAYHPVVQQILGQFSNDITFQFRNLPLSSIHPNAFAAARAAEAASKQNKFWEMNNLLYESQNWQAWTSSSKPTELFNQYAGQLGLNITQFKSDYASEEINALINADLAAYKKTGQEQATPSFFIDGKHIDNKDLSDSNGPSVDKFAKIIKDAINAKKP